MPLSNIIMKIKYLILLYIAFGVCASAQVIVVPSGGMTYGANGSSSYTIGQIVYNEVDGNTGAIKEGVQHAYTISSSSNIPENEKISLKCSIYPNPTQDILTLNIGISSLEGMSYFIYDNTGKVLNTSRTETNTTTIDMSAYKRNTYILKVLKNKHIIKTFTIIKK